MNKINSNIQNSKFTFIDIYPSKEEYQKAFKIAIEIKELIYPYLKSLEYFKDAIICGSLGKGTMLKNSSDIDIFIRFEFNDNIDFQNIIKNINELFKGSIIKHATYPYVEGEFKEYKINIVPCYYTKDISEIRSPVDRTPHHLDFINANLTENEKNEVIKLKSFLKNIEIYGADDITKGFSGYVTEVLIYKYKSFLNVLNIFAKTTDNVDTGIFIINDPVDTSRHLHKAISNENFGKFILAAREYLEMGTINETKLSIEEIENILKTNSIIVKHDPYYDRPKIIKETNKIINILSNNRYNIIYGFSHSIYSIIIVEHKIPSKIYVKKIMPITLKNAENLIPKISMENSLTYFINKTMELNVIKIEKEKLLSDILNEYNIVEFNNVDDYDRNKILIHFLK